jgi:hypothetical protein
MIAQWFTDELTLTLAVFERELKRAGLEAIWSKESAVATVIGVVAGSLSARIRLAFGLSGTLLAYQRKRREAFTKHWSSWLLSTEPDRFSVW